MILANGRRKDVPVMSSADPFERDAVGRTALFYAAEGGDVEAVRRIIFSLAGTGIGCQRLTLLQVKDDDGATASDVAGQNGHDEIAKLLRGEEMRMEFFE